MNKIKKTFGLVAFGVGITGFNIATTKYMITSPNNENDAVNAIKSVQQSEVSIMVYDSQNNQASGAGWIWDKQGDIATADHVIAGAAKIFVTLPNGEVRSASIVGGNEYADVAAININPAGLLLKPLSIDNTENLVAGQYVNVIGSPFGVTETPTRGIISAVNRELPAYARSKFIQIDAPINPGNSGGPDFIDNGTVIGMSDTLINYNGDSSAGIGFAIPINVVERTMYDILKYGEVKNGQVPFNFIDNTPQPIFGPPIKGTGIKITKVDDDPTAQNTGLKANDVIVQFNNTPIFNCTDFTVAAYMTEAGDMAVLTVLRQGKTLVFKVTMVGDIPPKHPGRPPSKPFAEVLPGMPAFNGNF